MKKLTTIIAVVALSMIAASESFSNDANSNAGTSSFSFLKIGVGARAVSMGGAFTGLSDDEASLYYNPAGLAMLDGDRVMFTYHNYVEDLQSGFLGYVREVSPRNTVGAFISYLNYGNFIQTDISGNETGTFGGGDFLFGVSFAHTQSRQLSFGGSLKFIYEKIQNFSATGVAADLGVKYLSARENWGLGAMAQNLGVQLSALGEEKDRLPISLRAGGFARPRDLDLLLTGDIILPVDNSPVFAIGGEYLDLKPLFLRMGWNSAGKNYRASDSKDKTAGLSFGIGVEHKQWRISYAFTPAADLGSSHRITLSTGIGQ